MENFLKDRVMRTIIKDKKSSWQGVISSVRGGTVLTPVVFVVYINDMTKMVESYMNMFTNDTKILQKIQEEKIRILYNKT